MRLAWFPVRLPRVAACSAMPAHGPGRCLSAALLTLLLGLVPTASAELYKYQNEDGVTVLDSHVPARYIKNGYTILSLDGRVLEVVPRALTDEEIRERDLRLAEEERATRKKREQEIADNSLLTLYSTPEDVIRARDTKLRSIDSFINTHHGNLTRLESQRRSLQSQAADIERAGGSLTKDRLDRIRTVETRIQIITDEIDEKQKEKQELEVSFATDLKRVRELYGAAPSRY